MGTPNIKISVDCKEFSDKLKPYNSKLYNRILSFMQESETSLDDLLNFLDFLEIHLRKHHMSLSEVKKVMTCKDSKALKIGLTICDILVPQFDGEQKEMSNEKTQCQKCKKMFPIKSMKYGQVRESILNDNVLFGYFCKKCYKRGILSI